MKYVIELPEYIKHEVDIEEDVDKAEDFIKWYSATLTSAIKDATPLQAELEEIKAEIDNIRDVEVKDGNIYVNEVNVFEILDKHINKADCDNDCEHCTWTECPKD